MRPLVSIIIPAYNAERYLSASLDSVYSQQTEAETEVIVVDDGSTDSTRASVHAYPRTTYLYQSNLGPAAARNAGLAHAKGTFVAFLDADDLWPEGKLQLQLELLRQHDRAALCFGDCQQFGNGTKPQTLFAQMENEVAAWGSGPFLSEAYERLLSANFITTGSVMARRETLLALGGFDASLRLVEDLELWLRVARQFPILWTPAVCLVRRRHPDNLSRDQEAMSLAYLSVLAHQRAAQDRGEVTRNVDIIGLMARECSHMADRFLLARRYNEALRWAWRGLSTRPSVGGAWRLTQGIGQWLMHRNDNQ